MTVPTHVYIARWPTCECIVAACVDDPDHASDTAWVVAEYIRRGRRVTRIPLEALKVTGWSRCPEHPRGTPAPREPTP